MHTIFHDDFAKEKLPIERQRHNDWRKQKPRVPQETCRKGSHSC